MQIGRAGVQVGDLKRHLGRAVDAVKQRLPSRRQGVKDLPSVPQLPGGKLLEVEQKRGWF